MSAPATAREAAADPLFAKLSRPVLVRMAEVEAALRDGAYGERPRARADLFSEEALAGSLICEALRVPLAQRAKLADCVREARAAGARAARRGGKLRIVGPLIEGREAVFLVLGAPRGKR